MVNDIHIGTDIVDVPRIKKILSSSHSEAFLRRTFSKAEIDYCQRKADPVIHFSGRFAAKEAIKKALMSSGLVKTISFSSIEVINDSNGAPLVKFHGGIDPEIKCKVSISHTASNAVGFAIIID